MFFTLLCAYNSLRKLLKCKLLSSNSGVWSESPFLKSVHGRSVLLVWGPHDEHDSSSVKHRTTWRTFFKNKAIVPAPYQSWLIQNLWNIGHTVYMFFSYDAHESELWYVQFFKFKWIKIMLNEEKYYPKGLLAGHVYGKWFKCGTRWFQLMSGPRSPPQARLSEGGQVATDCPKEIAPSERKVPRRYSPAREVIPAPSRPGSAPQEWGLTS